jgi:hypothetical protein
VSQRLSQVGLSYSGWSTDQHVPFLVDVSASSQLEHLLSVDVRIEVKVETFQRLGSIDRCPTNPES